MVYFVVLSSSNNKALFRHEIKAFSHSDIGHIYVNIPHSRIQSGSWQWWCEPQCVLDVYYSYEMVKYNTSESEFSDMWSCRLKISLFYMLKLMEHCSKNLVRSLLTKTVTSRVLSLHLWTLLSPSYLCCPPSAWEEKPMLQFLTVDIAQALWTKHLGAAPNIS